MSRSTVDRHPEKARIERELALGIPLQRIAKKFDISKDAAHRHKKKLPPQLKRALATSVLKPEADLQKLRVEESESLLSSLASERARLWLMQDKALETEQLSVATQIAGALHRNLELVGKYLGEFAQHSVHTSISLVVSEEYLRFRATLTEALRPFPEAARAVAAVLHRQEEAAASAMSSPKAIEHKPVEVAPCQ